MTHRRELSKQYKEAAPRRGAYAIRNPANQVVFVGASPNVDGAINRDRFQPGHQAQRNRHAR